MKTNNNNVAIITDRVTIIEGLMSSKIGGDLTNGMSDFVKRKVFNHYYNMPSSKIEEEFEKVSGGNKIKFMSFNFVEYID